MEQQSRLKQRLVGVIVLVALAVIFVPMILNGEREEDFIVNGSSVPARPAEIENIRQLEFGTKAESELPSEKLAIRIPVDKRSAALSIVEKKPEPTKDAVKMPPPELRVSTPVVKKKKQSVAPVTRAWAIQVGSFKQKSNALKLRDKLRKQKYKAFVEGLQSNTGTVYRVRLGPYVSRTRAEQMRDKILTQQKMKGLLVRHP